jgi:DNA-binding MltR family transcriptional regulator
LIATLKKRTKTRHTDADLNPILQEASEGSDRTAAIVWGSFIEEHLRRRMTHHMHHMSDSELDAFFGEGGAASDFSKKVQIYYAMGKLSSEYKSDLNLIREIRNAFAHCQTPLKFDDPSVYDVCKLLIAPLCWLSTHKNKILSKELFIMSCMFYLSGMREGPPRPEWGPNQGWWSGEPVPWL